MKRTWPSALFYRILVLDRYQTLVNIIDKKSLLDGVSIGKLNLCVNNNLFCHNRWVKRGQRPLLINFLSGINLMPSSSTVPGLLLALFFQRLIQQGKHGLIFVATGGPFGINQ